LIASALCCDVVTHIVSSLIFLGRISVRISGYYVDNGLQIQFSSLVRLAAVKFEDTHSSKALVFLKKVEKRKV
jgi:hypothetical protein